MPLSPKLEAAIERLAQQTVRMGGDPVRVLLALQAAAKYRDEVWPTLSPRQRYAVLRRLRRLREENRRGHQSR